MQTHQSSLQKSSSALNFVASRRHFAGPSSQQLGSFAAEEASLQPGQGGGWHWGGASSISPTLKHGLLRPLGRPQ